MFQMQCFVLSPFLNSPQPHNPTSLPSPLFSDMTGTVEAAGDTVTPIAMDIVNVETAIVAMATTTGAEDRTTAVGEGEGTKTTMTATITVMTTTDTAPAMTTTQLSTTTMIAIVSETTTSMLTTEEEGGVGELWTEGDAVGAPCVTTTVPRIGGGEATPHL